MITDFPDILTIRESCMLLRVSQKTLYKLIHERKIKAKKVARQYRIRKTELLRYLDEN